MAKTQVEEAQGDAVPPKVFDDRRSHEMGYPVARTKKLISVYYADNAAADNQNIHQSSPPDKISDIYRLKAISFFSLSGFIIFTRDPPFVNIYCA
jgi:hypothetical protein